MTSIPEFKPFTKIARFSRPFVITEKIDGTNASVHITDEGQFLTASRTRWITPDDDNYGFSRWAHEHEAELRTLGPGSHFGEWWGQGIQRNYGLKEKRFSLFNVSRWCLAGETPKTFPTPDPRVAKTQEVLPPCVGLVPRLIEGADFSEVGEAARACLADLRANGSVAVKTFANPEGIVIYHAQGNILFKKTLDKDGEPKSKLS